MSCGTPCVVTDVGDSRLIVGDTGRVVPAKDPGALAAAIVEMLAMPSGDRARLGLRARQRVQQLFDLDSVTRRYESLYHEHTSPGEAVDADLLEDEAIGVA
jgi:glycosyltransferase involved in cell wall biosynthesis